MKKTICVITATRAEYGLLKRLINRLNSNIDFEVRVVVTGTHLSSEFGLTYKEIEEDGIVIHEKIDILVNGDSASSISKTMGLAMISFGEYFSRDSPDLLLLLGDRYEMLAVASAAMIHNIPIAHIHGGEKTEGVIDEAIRHSITKMSYLHFTTTSEYRDRVIQLGENPNRVYNFGALGVENILNEQLLSKEELEHLLQTRLNKPFVLVTYHPVTLEKQTLVEHMNSIFQVCKKFNNVKFIFTKSNADEGGRQINEMIDSFVSSNENTVSYKSLGMLKYLSALKYCDVVMGNSSSGIIEAPSFKIPTINIGDRQKGRLQSNSIINCEPEASEIVKALNKCMNITYRKSLRGTINPYGNGNTSIKISSVIKKFLFENDQDLKKNFYDIGICK